MMSIISRYLIRSFVGLFLFCIAAVVVLFVIVDLVENMDTFIDKGVPTPDVLRYYLYYIPFILVLIMPVATLLATVFSVSNMARSNEIIALKALGYSMYQMMGTLAVMGALVAVLAFFTSEVLVARTAEPKASLEEKYGFNKKHHVSLSKLRNLEIRHHGRLFTLGRLNPKRQLATRIKIEDIENGRIVSRMDADSMAYVNGQWIIWKGMSRRFIGDSERLRVIDDSVKVGLDFSPKELMRAQSKPEDMAYWELRRYVSLMRRSGAEVHAFLTELHLRISFPLASVIIVLFSLPMAYNRRKKSVAIGFGIALAITFVYFGMVKMGQSMGQNGSLHPLLAAWLGNGVMIAGSVVTLIKTRK